MSQHVDGPTLSLVTAAAIGWGERVAINSSGQAILATASLKAVGVCTQPAASGGVCTVKLLHADGTFIVKAAAAVAVNGLCYGAASGKVNVTPTATERFRAKQAATADGDLIEVVLEQVEANVRVRGTPATATTAKTLTAAEIATGRIVGTHPGGGASVALTLPLAADMDTGFPDVPVGGEIDFDVINIGTAAAADVYTLTTNTGWTLSGNMAVPSNHTTTGGLTGGNVRKFSARKTGTAAWTLYIAG